MRALFLGSSGFEKAKDILGPLHVETTTDRITNLAAWEKKLPRYDLIVLTIASPKDLQCLRKVRAAAP